MYLYFQIYIYIYICHKLYINITKHVQKLQNSYLLNICNNNQDKRFILNPAGPVRKQTRQGWDHTIQLNFKGTTKTSPDHDTFSFEWTRKNNRNPRRIPLSAIHEIQCWPNLYGKLYLWYALERWVQDKLFLSSAPAWRDTLS